MLIPLKEENCAGQEEKATIATPVFGGPPDGFKGFRLFADERE
jgi:hypothetical protein